MSADGEGARLLDRVPRRHHLAHLLRQIRPYGDGMERQSLVLDAMECPVTEIFNLAFGLYDCVTISNLKPKTHKYVFFFACLPSLPSI